MARLLLVDDEADIRTYVAKLLELDGHEVSVAASGREALDRGPVFRPDVVIADDGLNDRYNGLEVIRGLQETLPGIATILISGFPFGQLKRSGETRGVGALVAKPFTIDELRTALDSVLAEHA